MGDAVFQLWAGGEIYRQKAQLHRRIDHMNRQAEVAEPVFRRGNYGAAGRCGYGCEAGVHESGFQSPVTRDVEAHHEAELEVHPAEDGCFRDAVAAEKGGLPGRGRHFEVSCPQAIVGGSGPCDTSRHAGPDNIGGDKRPVAHGGTCKRNGGTWLDGRRRCGLLRFRGRLLVRRRLRPLSAGGLLCRRLPVGAGNDGFLGAGRTFGDDIDRIFGAGNDGFLGPGND